MQESKREQLLQEFLGVNKHKSKQQMFANDEVAPDTDLQPALADDEAAEGESSDATEHNIEDMSDLEYLRSRMGKLDSGACCCVNRARAAHAHAGYASAHTSLCGPPFIVSGIQTMTQHSRTGAEVRNSEQDMPEAPSPADARQQSAGAPTDAVALIGQTAKLFVRNLPFVTTNDDLLSLMKAYGDVEDVRVVRDKSTGASKGFALVQFKSAPDAVAAYQAMDGEAFQGRLLHIIPGKAAEQAPIPEGSEAEAPRQSGFKAERDSKRKANAGDKSAWSTFFMREDTVAQAVAELLGVTKAELLDPEAPDAAVRMALGETQARCHFVASIT